MIVSGNDVIGLIPQKPPMVMVDRLYECEDGKAITGFTITKENILVRDGFLSEAGLIENMAQSSALMTGWLAKEKAGGEPGLEAGVIGGIKDFRLYFLPAAGSDILTEIIIAHRIGNATIVNGKITSGNKISAECELKIFISAESQ